MSFPVNENRTCKSLSKCNYFLSKEHQITLKLKIKFPKTLVNLDFTWLKTAFLIHKKRAKARYHKHFLAIQLHKVRSFYLRFI